MISINNKYNETSDKSEKIKSNCAYKIIGKMVLVRPNI